MKIALLMGGKSSEREVSLVSGEACRKSLINMGHVVRQFDPVKSLPEFINELTNFAPDVAFNALHGRFGEDGGIQSILEWLRIPYTHSGRFASALAMNKKATLAVLSGVGIPVPNGYVATEAEIRSPNFSVSLPYPFVIKPVFEGSSVGLYIVHSKEEMPDLTNWAFGEALIEEYIAGMELTVTVLNGLALAVTELRPTSGQYDYESKYTDGKTQHIIPAKISPILYEQCLRYAEKAYFALGVHTLGRVDFRYDPAKDKLCMLEMNTQPGMTSLSLVPEQARYLDMNFDKLVETILIGASLKDNLIHQG